MITYIIIAAIVIAIICVLIVLFARKASMSDTTTKSASGAARPVTTTVSKTMASKVTLTPEQAASLKKANSELVTVKMTLNKIQNSEIRKAGEEACGSIENVLSALKEKPEKIQTSRQLFNYYLPTMDTVLTKFQRIEASGVDNPDMPENLKKYLSDIKDGMTNMYEGLYDNDKLTVAVDMEAMTMAIKRDGLLDDSYFANIKADDDLDPGLKTTPDFDSIPDAAAKAAKALEPVFSQHAVAVADTACEAVQNAGEVIAKAKEAIENAGEAAGEAVGNAAGEAVGNAEEADGEAIGNAEDLFDAAAKAVENDFADFKEAVKVEAVAKEGSDTSPSVSGIKLTLDPDMDSEN